MKNNITEMVFILDRSGSMCGLESDTIGGFNSMIEKQKKEDGTAYVTTVLFNDKYETVHDRIDLKDVKKMTDRDYTTFGSTALLDAVGRTINHISDVHRYIRKEDVPENTIFIITTDGMENASREFDYNAVKKLIDAKKELGWEFLFIGANIDAAKEASKMGIASSRAVEYACDSKGTGVLFGAVTNSLSRMRKCGAVSEDWCEEIREDTKKRKR